jgi:cytochrome o ubiquinol oxidase subunit IV
MANTHVPANHSAQPGHNEKHESPKQYIIGYLLSLILTIAAIWLTVAGVMGVGALVTTILILAGLQILVQLFFFMHINEGEGPAYHVMALILGLIFTAVFIGGSIWIMSFNSMVH